MVNYSYTQLNNCPNKHNTATLAEHIFEHLRVNSRWGGLAIGCLEELKPVWVRDGGDSVEAMSIEVSIKDIKIRCCAAYGCQEN